MTKSQERAIENIKRLVEKELGERREIKEWDVDDGEYFVSLYIVYGVKDDEGTMAAYFRNTAHLFIGKRGAVTYPVWSKTKKTSITRKFHGYSILEAVCDQR